MTKYALPRYRPSGRLKPTIFALFLAAIAGGCLVAFVYQTLLRWIPYVYVNALLVAGFGGVLGFAGHQAVKRGHCRNRALAAVLALALAGVSLAASYYWDWQHALSVIAEKNPGLDKAAIADEITFSRFLELKKESGWKLKSSTFNGGGVTFIWVVEALLVFGLAIFITDVAAAEPYCEKCGRWCEGRQFQLPGTSRADADGYLAQGQLGPLTQINGRADADPHTSLHFTVTTCAGCADTGFLTVAEQQIQQKKKQTQTVRRELVRHAVLTPADRELAVDRVQSAIGQKLAS
jgi:hypothetical protein